MFDNVKLRNTWSQLLAKRILIFFFPRRKQPKGYILYVTLLYTFDRNGSLHFSLCSCESIGLNQSFISYEL